MPEISLEHIRDLITAQSTLAEAKFEGVRREMAAGFGGVNGRLDIVNGRLGKHGTRLDALEDKVRLHRRTGDAKPTLHARREDSTPLTRRDALMFAAGGGAIWGLIKGGAWLLEVAKSAGVAG